MAVLIFPRIHRGCLYFEIGPVLFSTFAQVPAARFAAEARRLDIVDGGVQ